MFFFFDEEPNTLTTDKTLSDTSSPNEETNYSESLFESIKHINEYGQEFWYARELQIALEYKQWRRFESVIEKAMLACENAGFSRSEHFADVGKTSSMPNGGEKIIKEYALSRYACYLIVQNGDPRKKVIALGQTYFAVKTRQQELIENYEQMTEDQKRLAIRYEMTQHNKQLVAAAKDAGVENNYDYAIFQNYGYKGLYGGLGAKRSRLNLTCLLTMTSSASLQKLRVPDLKSLLCWHASDCAALWKAGGWKTDHVMKNVYRHAQKEKEQEMQMRAGEHLKNVFSVT